ncbi:MAG: HEAT repeat domain-containing protein [Phycisphaerales bacterium]|nr:HEAT repeat domain-containing protein [Phycisphaerales bacterium]
MSRRATCGVAATVAGLGLLVWGMNEPALDTVVAARVTLPVESRPLPPTATNESVLASVPRSTKSPQAARALVLDCRTAGPRDVPRLRTMLADPDPLVVGNALRALVRLRALAGIDLFALLADPRLRVRQEAVLAMQATGDARYVPALESCRAEKMPQLADLVDRAVATLCPDLRRMLVPD